MQIPNFQPQIPPAAHDRTEAPAPSRPRRASGDGLDGVGLTSFESTANGSSEPGAFDSAETVDAVEISKLSRIVFDSPDRDIRVEALEKSYNSGGYSANPEALARSIVRVYIGASEATEPRGDDPSRQGSGARL